MNAYVRTQALYNNTYAPRNLIANQKQWPYFATLRLGRRLLVVVDVIGFLVRA